ncbi:MAG: hypothetical protein K2O83_08820, partial [Schaedlerella arabinosiphila]|nr:hypothetical protein [Schaedlerella arabinosiphila]
LFLDLLQDPPYTPNIPELSNWGRVQREKLSSLYLIQRKRKILRTTKKKILSTLPDSNSLFPYPNSVF